VRRRTIAIIAAVVLALAAAGLVVWYVSSLRSEESVAEQTQAVLVATADIPARISGEDIVANNLIERREVVVSSVASGALTSESQLQGTVLTVPVAKGQQILQSQLGAPEEQSLSYRMKTGMRAISIAVDRRNAVGGAIKEGDRVDVIATFDAGQFNAVQLTPPTTAPPAVTPGSTTSTTISLTPMGLGMVLPPAEIARVKALTGIDLTPTVSAVSATILQQVEVLAMDILLPVTTQSEGRGGVLSGGAETTTEEVPDLPVITLMLSPADAEKIVYAQTFGQITFTLVPAQDTTKVDTTGRALPNMFR
jgi:Flp pilus assembly protein CpaB